MAAAISIEQTLSKAIRSIPIAGVELLRFYDMVGHYLHELDASQDEEHNKRLVGRLLEQLFYGGKNAVNSANPIDLAIFADAVAKDSRPVVMFEVKQPANPEMVRRDDLNRKTLHELVLYYVREELITLSATHVTHSRKVTSAYRLLSPTHLLKQPVMFDHNDWSMAFYHELLYIMGLEEVMVDNIARIVRCKPSQRQQHSLLEETIRLFDERDTLMSDEEKEEAALGLVMTWMNRNEMDWKILKKVKTTCKQLTAWHPVLYRGLLTGRNDVFIINDSKRQEILNQCQTEDERKRTAMTFKPLVKGEDLKRYQMNFADRWLILISLLVLQTRYNYGDWHAEVEEIQGAAATCSRNLHGG